MTRPGEIDAVLDTLMATDWVVYTRDCLEHTETVVDYLARYTRRIAITNARILAVDDERVTLRCRDYRDRGRHRALELDGTEFVRRFLLHVLPKGLMRVRHYGFLANRCRREKLGSIRAALAAPAPEPSDPDLQGPAVIPNVCPRCRRPAMRVTAAIPPAAQLTPARAGGAPKTALIPAKETPEPIRPGAGGRTRVRGFWPSGSTSATLPPSAQLRDGDDARTMPPSGRRPTSPTAISGATAVCRKTKPLYNA